VELLFVALTIANPSLESDKSVMRNLILFAVAVPLISACTVAKTAVDVVTLPVKVASAGVDAATTSQSERDEKAGRELRKQDEERGRLRREMMERCRKGKPLPADDCQTLQPR
jgi:hypothetical protein